MEGRSAEIKGDAHECHPDQSATKARPRFIAHREIRGKEPAYELPPIPSGPISRRWLRVGPGFPSCHLPRGSCRKAKAITLKRETTPMKQQLTDAYERWWKRQRDAGLALSDDFEVACLEAIARAAYEAGARAQLRLSAEHG